jgi:outer membrane protein OmpA-like peptidoglycan-associated protein
MKYLKKVPYFLLMFLLFNNYLSGQSIQGLRGEYYNDIDLKQLVHQRIDKRIYLNSSYTSPAPGINGEYFSIRWTGKIYAPASGKYTFHVLSDDGIRLWINNTKIIDEWRPQEASSFSGDIVLDSAHLYDFKMEYYNTIIYAVLKLEWECPLDAYTLFGYTFYQPNTEIPAEYFQYDSTRVITVKDTPLIAETTKAIKPKPSPKPRQIVSPSVTKKDSTFVVDRPIVLKSVRFEQSKYELLKESYDELDKIITHLHRNPSFKIEIYGHTDYAGDSAANLVLSQQRADVVAGYFVEKGILKEKIKATGLGCTKPLVTDIPEDRSMNRRVEIILKQ